MLKPPVIPKYTIPPQIRRFAPGKLARSETYAGTPPEHGHSTNESRLSALLWPRSRPAAPRLCAYKPLRSALLRRTSRVPAVSRSPVPPPGCFAEIPRCNLISQPFPSRDPRCPPTWSAHKPPAPSPLRGSNSGHLETVFSYRSASLPTSVHLVDFRIQTPQPPQQREGAPRQGRYIKPKLHQSLQTPP